MKTQTGKVKFYDSKKGFGFIHGKDGQDYYFRLAEGEWLPEKQEVSFRITQGHKGAVASEVQEIGISLKNQPAQRIEGIVKFFDKRHNYGIIVGNDGKEYYFDNVGNRYSRATIWRNSHVNFETTRNERGLLAENIECIFSPYAKGKRIIRINQILFLIGILSTWLVVPIYGMPDGLPFIIAIWLVIVIHHFYTIRCTKKYILGMHESD